VFGARSARAERGHNYVLEVTLRGPVDPETGMVIDLKHVKDVVEREIAERFDHKQLNADTPWFRERAPTAENFARVIFDLLDAAFPAGLLLRVRLWPTSDWFVEVER